MNAPERIYCADGNSRFAQIAIEQGFTYGAQLPKTVYFKPGFVDQKYKQPNRKAYMKALETYRPHLATVLDYDHNISRDEVLSWADEASRYTDTIIIIPKIRGTIKMLPRQVNGKPVRLGYSVPTSFGKSTVPLTEFLGWPLHLLGGSPSAQLALGGIKKQATFEMDLPGLNVQSVDGNYHQLLSQTGQFFANGQANTQDKTWPRLEEVCTRIPDDVPYHAFRLSCANIQAAWNGCRAYIRYGNESDLDAIKRVANQYKNELGFVNKAALRDSISRYTLFVAEYMGAVVGLVNSYRRKDGWSTIYEIAVDKAHKGEGIGRALLDAVPRPVRLKCTLDNPANEFYLAQGMQLIRVEQGRKRMLNVWERLLRTESEDK